MFWNRRRNNCQNVEAGAAPCLGPGMLNGCDCALSGVVKGCRCRIRRHHAHGAVRQRLLDMGFVPNAEVEVMRVATLGDPMEVKVGDSFITLRKHEADQIEIVNN